MLKFYLFEKLWHIFLFIYMSIIHNYFNKIFILKLGDILITYDIILFLIFLILLSNTLIIYIRNRQSIKLKSNNMQAFSDQFFSNNQVSIIIPARNEESTIRTAILTLSKIIYPNFNIIIVNDNSTDNTKAIAMECSKFFQNDIFHVIDAPEIPKVNGIFQWMGKQHACWQGANSIYAKKSKYFLFLDSDVQVSPNVLKSIVTIFINEKVDLLSINLRISPNSLFSKMIAAPLLLLETLSIFNPKYTKKTNSNEIGVAYGGCIFISKDSYFDSGAHSHKNVKSKILDDIALATLYRSKGYFTTIKQNKDIHHINMYPSARSLYFCHDKHVKGQMQNP